MGYNWTPTHPTFPSRAKLLTTVLFTVGLKRWLTPGPRHATAFALLHSQLGTECFIAQDLAMCKV